MNGYSGEYRAYPPHARMAGGNIKKVSVLDETVELLL
jgi:hypothetical protein